MKFSESIETYLKEIYRLSETNDCVRSIDVANRLKVSKASVNRAVKKLCKEGYIDHQPYGLIFITETGTKKAQDICLRQEIITKYLTKTLGIDNETAFAEACKIEHVVSHKIIMMIKELYD
tara:strand:+ start:104 stop:466 length:363 start_codon:yes stop_codon:yes gene_type:complete